jgi:hypothetical protein
MKKSPLKKNLNLLSHIDSKLAYQLTLLNPNDVQFCQTQQGELNLCRTYQGQTYFYHSNEHAAAEAQKWFKELHLTNETVLYVYGVGLGYYAEATQDWLKVDSKHTLIFLEKDLTILYRLLETSKGTWILKHPQIHLIAFENIFTDQALFNELSWNYIACPLAISSLKLYAEVDSEGFLQLRHLITHNAVKKESFVAEYLQYGVAFFRNFYPNLLQLPHSYLGNGLFHSFRNIPAIICGAGPSLNQNIQLLKTLTDQALIFAGSSALNAIIPEVIPHFGVAVDPNQAQYSRVKAAQSYSIPFFYRNRLFHDALTTMTGPRLYLTGAGGYDTAEWFENQLGIQGGEPLDEGHNVINFCIEIAHALGCSPIILVGIDLAYTNDQYYFSQVIENLHLTEQDFEKMKEFDLEKIDRIDIHGQPIKTTWKWVTEAEWITEFAQTHPETPLINATEGGLGFQNIPNQTLEKVAQIYLKPIPDLQKTIQEEIQQHSLSALVTEEKVIELIKTVQESLRRCIKQIEKIVHELHELKILIQKQVSYPASLQTPSIRLTEMEIEEEPAYQAILNSFNLIYLHLHNREILELQPPRKGHSAKKIDLKKIDLQVQRLHFLKDVSCVNIELIERSLFMIK